MDSRFRFLGADQVELLNAILARRNPALLERVRQGGAISRSDAEDIMSVIAAEFTNNLDDDFEPTERGLAVSAVLARFNKAHLSDWP